MHQEQYKILFTVDVEDWFQVENFRRWNPYLTWESRELRIEQNVHRLLELFDSSPVNAQQPVNPTPSTTPTKSGNAIKATFFILGWVAKRLPHLVREINSRGHEVASHGYNHELPQSLPRRDLKNDLTDSKKILEDIIGNRVYGYRAPSFSIDDGMLRLIKDCGYLYDSSFNSFSIHKRYGELNLSTNSRNGIAVNIFSRFYELPISNLKLGGVIVPWGGGGYFRLIPISIFVRGVWSILRAEKAFLFYVHPWEVDPLQPKMANASWFYRFRHYTNLHKTFDRLSSLIRFLGAIQFISCSDYIVEKFPGEAENLPRGE